MRECSFPSSPPPPLVDYAEIYALGGCVSNHLSRVEIVCLLLSFLRPPTFSLPPPPPPPLPPDPPPPSHDAQKGYDIILEWALRYIALFLPAAATDQNVMAVVTEVYIFLLLVSLYVGFRSHNKEMQNYLN